MKKLIFFLFSLLLVFFIFDFKAEAAIIKGQVIDGNTHDVVPGTEVFIINNLKFYSVVDVKGNYEISGLSVGTYKVVAKSVSFLDFLSKEITITNIHEVVKLNIILTPDIRNLDEVKVQGKKNIENSVTARMDERKASNVINIMSAKTIEQLPDLNVADIMQRISGVSMTKNSYGSNSKLIIRGMPSRYNNTLIDGVEAPSTSSSGRSVSLDMFGADLIGRIEVIKALTPDISADGIGGTVNLILKRTPDQPFFNASIGTGYNSYYFNHRFLTFDNSTVSKKDFSEINGPDFLAQESLFPRQNLLIIDKKAMPDINFGITGGKRFFNKKLGAMFAASFRNNSVANTYDYTSYSPSRSTGKPVPDYYEHQVYSKSEKRFGGYVKFDYKFNDNNSISFNSSYFQSNELRARKYSDHQTENGGEYIRPIASQTETDNSGIFSNTLSGKHDLLNDLQLDWSLNYAKANSSSPDFATVELAKGGDNPSTLNYSKPVVRDWQWNIDQNKSMYLNLIYRPNIYNHIVELKGGGMYRKKYRKNYANEYYFQPYNDNSSLDYRNYPDPNILTVPLRNDENAQEQKGNAVYNSGNYRAWENIGAFYIMLSTTIGHFDVLTGLRFETTYLNTEHNQNNIQFPVAKTTIKYYNLFPSFHLKYKLSEKQNLRFSYYKGISRPSYTEIIPYNDPRAGSQFGNPDLKPALANCFDLRYEIYPKQEDVFTVGLFYKKITNAIEDILNKSNNAVPANVTTPTTNFGVELVAIKKIHYITLSANYTYTKSIIHDKAIDFVYIGDSLVGNPTVSYTRTLIGQSPHLLNINISYHNDIGTKMSLAYSMRGCYLSALDNSHLHYNRYQATYNDLGLSVEQKIGKKFYVSAKMSNILNSPVEWLMKEENNTPIRKTYDYRHFSINLKYSL